jgi:metal-responsive CopG/Arc/MetJ family transcriptional regulator
MSRILVDLPAAQIQALAALVKTERHSRDAVIRDAIDTYIGQRMCASGADVFGLWKNRQIDGLAYQKALRGEW